MSKKIAVLGNGATGSVNGGLLTAAGHDVTMIDQWAAHVDAIYRHSAGPTRPFFWTCAYLT